MKIKGPLTQNKFIFEIWNKAEIINIRLWPHSMILVTLQTVSSVKNTLHSFIIIEFMFSFVLPSVPLRIVKLELNQYLFQIFDHPYFILKKKKKKTQDEYIGLEVHLIKHLNILSKKIKKCF